MMVADKAGHPQGEGRVCGDRLLLFPSRVLTRSGSADPELTVSAWLIR